MRHNRYGRWLAGGTALGLLIAGGKSPAAQPQEPWAGALDEHPSIQYAARPTTDRVARFNRAVTRSARPLQRDPRTGYLRSVLDALGVPVESQLLVFSKTGVQRAYTSPRTPRALFFDESVVVSYVPQAPVIEVAAHDPQQGIVFYTFDQSAAAPGFTRQTSCLSCHVSASTLEVPGLIARSHTVGDDGNILPGTGTTDVDQRTPHPDRWGGWFVTSEGGAPPYSQMAHRGNITFSEGGNTSNQVFVDWLNSSPEARGYLLPSSDIATLLVFDHEMHAINLLTRLNWESRIDAGDGRTGLSETTQGLVNQLADYLLFRDEAPPLAPLTPRAGFAAYLAAKVPQDRRGRSFGQLDLVNRLLRYPCSYMVYSEAFDGLPAAVKERVYRRMVDVLTESDALVGHTHPSAADRRAVLDILKDTKPDFPGGRS